MYMVLSMLKCHIETIRRMNDIHRKKIDILLNIYQSTNTDITTNYMKSMANLIKITIQSMNETEYNTFMNDTLPFLLEVEEDRLENDGSEVEYLTGCNRLKMMHKICEYYKVCL